MSSAPAAQIPPEPTPIRPASNRERPATLPRPLTSFVGRERETEAVVALLADPRSRLVTLTGPGGVGKTRLAINLVERIGREYPGGVWFVPLASIQDPELVAGAIAHVIASPSSGQQTAEEHVVATLQAGRALLILDNFEHLPGAAPLVGRLLSACPTLTILVTSRTHLRISCERPFDVPPLPVPALGSECLGHHDAVRLFIERATAADPALTEAPPMLELIAEICRLLDGLPLAIELAAAWAGVLPLVRLRERLGTRLPMLAGGFRDSPARHQTMRDSISWSYDLLTPGEQAVFRRAGVFVGGFCLEAIEEVAADAVGRDTVLGLVRGLVEKSLVRPAPIADVPRYHMLETIREFALDRLEAASELEATRAVHAEWCAGFAERFGAEVTGPELATWIHWAQSELDNVRSALGYAEARGDGARAVRLAGGIGWLWMYPGRLDEGRAALQRSVSMPGAESSPRTFAIALMYAAGIEYWQEEFAAGRALYERALAVCRACGDDRLAAVAMRGIATGAIFGGDPKEASEWLADYRQQSIGSISAWDTAYAEHLTGLVELVSGDPATAFAWQEQALGTFRGMGDREYTGNCLEALGWAALRLGEPGSAQQAFHELLETGGAGDRWCRARALRGLGAVAAKEDPRRAARLLAAADMEFEAAGARQRIPVKAYYIEIRDCIRAWLGDAIFAEEWARGTDLTPEEAVTEGRSVATADVPEPCPLEIAFGLTRRETEVLRLVAEGLTDKEIADRLYISRRTVSKHVESILAKLDVDSRRAAALEARGHIAP